MKCLNTYSCYDKDARPNSNFCSFDCKLIYEGKLTPPLTKSPDTLKDRKRKARLSRIKNNDEFIDSLPTDTKKQRKLKGRYQFMWEEERQYILDHLDKSIFDIFNRAVDKKEIIDKRGVKTGSKRGSYKTKDVRSNCKQCGRKFKAMSKRTLYCSIGCRQKAYRLRKVRQNISQY